MTELKRKSRGRESGSMMLWSITVAAALSAMLFMLPSGMLRRKKFALDDRQRFEAYLLASDIIEIGKFLTLYEKIYFTTDPLTLNVSGSGMTRAECLRNLWGQHFGAYDPASASLLDACGSIGANGAYLGTNKASCGGSIPVLGPDRRTTFCPQYVRSALLSGDMIERMLFERWADTSRSVVQKLRDGVFRIDIDLTSAFDPKPSAQAELSIPLYFGQRLLDENFSFFRAAGLQATLSIEYFTDRASFVAASAERYIKITGKITFTGARNTAHVIERSETMMMALSTPKDFALFIPYPDTGALPAASDTAALVESDDTALMSQAMLLPASTEIHGRVYFNGDLDVPMDDLPKFHEAVALSGNVRDAAGKIPGPSSLPILREKFKKGLVANISSARYIFDGRCAPNGPSSTPPASNIEIANGSRLHCDDGIVEYIDRLNAQPFLSCWNVALNASSTGTTEVAGSRRPASAPDCPAAVPNQVDFVGRGVREITVQPPWAPIMTPVKVLTVNNGASVYGTVFGGHVVSQMNTKFYSISALKVGLPGIGSESALVSFNSSATATNAGVSIGMLNLPVIMVTGDEGK